jgi:hypothetical protein
VLFTFWWMLWKERNNRIFENKENSAPQLAQLIIDEIILKLSVYLPRDEVFWPLGGSASPPGVLFSGYDLAVSGRSCCCSYFAPSMLVDIAQWMLLPGLVFRIPAQEFLEL